MESYLDNYANSYDANFKFELDNKLILNWYPKRVLNLTSGNSLLELGIGHGYAVAKFDPYFKRHVVIDGSKEVIEQFKKKFRLNNIEIIFTYFEDFNTDEKFDVIVMGFILEHVEKPSLILDKYKEFLNPNGSIFITVPNAEALNKRFGKEAGLIKDLYQLSDADKLQGHRRLFCLNSLKELVQSSGYCIQKIEGLFLKPITTSQIQTLNLSPEILESMLKVGIHYPELSVGILMEVKCL